MDPLSNFPPDFVAYDQGGIVIRSTVTMVIIATLIAALRIHARVTGPGRMCIDDWLIIASLPFLYGTAVCAFVGVIHGGVGRHVAVVAISAPEELVTTLFCLFVAESVYATVIMLIKVSIICMYRRIFPTRFVIRASNILGVTVLLWWLAVVLVSVVQCQPLQKAWDTSLDGHCINTNLYLISNAVPNIITDIAMLCLPIYEVYQLHMPVVKKVGVSGIFLLGGFVIIISCVRLKVVYDMTFGGNADLTAWIWTVLEPSVGIICACLPTMKSLTHFLFGNFLVRTFSNAIGHSSFNTVITFGGGSFRPINRTSNRTNTNSNGSSEKYTASSNCRHESFERLGDYDANRPTQSTNPAWAGEHSKARKDIKGT